MKKTLHRASTRGGGNHGWLKTRHTFSFADYYDPTRMNFGVLRVLNDDVIEAAQGFGSHPHQNMEIVTIPLSGTLEHKDSMGHTQIIRTGDVQIMSAGTGVVHSEFNHSKTEPVSLLQIWVLPQKMSLPPRYEQKSFNLQNRLNRFQNVVSPEKSEGTLWINQEARFSLAHLQARQNLNYALHHQGHGAYVFIIEGEVSVMDEKLQARDGLGLEEIKDISFQALTDADLLVIEVPLLNER